MLAFPEMLIEAAKNAGIETPENCPRDIQEIKEQFPAFFVFCTMQLGQSMPYPSVHFDNAKVIASIPQEQLRSITVHEIYALGFQSGKPLP